LLQLLSVRRPLAVDQLEFRRIRDAVAKHLSGEVILDGVTVKVADLLAEIDTALAKFPAAIAAQAALRQARAQRIEAIASIRARIGDLKSYCRAYLASTDPRLAAFGFEQKVRRPLTSQEKTIKAAKARLTRNVRGTKGAKQKREITAAGKPGLLLVGADGTPMPDVLKGPTPPRNKK
jgi:predicted ATPase with chaperone activity